MAGIEGRCGRTLGIFCLVFLPTWIASTVIGGMAGAIATLHLGLAEDLRSALVVAAASGAGALVAPVSSIAMILIDDDPRLRREGFDLDQLAHQAQPSSAA